MAFDDDLQRERLSDEVARRLRDRFGPHRPALTVSGAVFVCTGPR